QHVIPDPKAATEPLQEIEGEIALLGQMGGFTEPLPVKIVPTDHGAPGPPAGGDHGADDAVDQVRRRVNGRLAQFPVFGLPEEMPFAPFLVVVAMMDLVRRVVAIDFDDLSPGCDSLDVARRKGILQCVQRIPKGMKRWGIRRAAAEGSRRRPARQITRGFGCVHSYPSDGIEIRGALALAVEAAHEVVLLPEVRPVPQDQNIEDVTGGGGVRGRTLGYLTEQPGLVGSRLKAADR